MFGYITIDKPELKIKDYNTFRAYYCGLCRELSVSYPLIRPGLSYDCTFLYILLAALSKDKPVYENRCCISHPFRKAPMALDAGRSYAAAINVLLTVEKLKDNAEDDKNAAAAAAAAMLRGYEKKAAAYCPEAAASIKKYSAELKALEQSKEASIDRPADAFGKMLADIFKYAGAEPLPMHELGLNLGRFIYIADAAEDALRDEQKHRYNPLLLKYKEVNSIAKEDVLFYMNCCINEAYAAYDLLDIEMHRAILDNILTGLFERAKQIAAHIGLKHKRHEGRNTANGSV